MSEDLLQEAIKNLSIQAVYLRESRFTQVEDFDPTVLMEFEMTAQYRSGTVAKHLVNIEDSDGSNKHTLMNVHFTCGLRLIDATRVINSKPETGAVAEISAVFVAQYLVADGSNPRQEALDAFAQKNAGYHVWPYWREYAQSVCMRAGLPVAVIPLFTVPKENQPKPSKDIQPKPTKKAPKDKALPKRSARSKTL